MKTCESTVPTSTWYDIPYPAADYTFPYETLLRNVRLDNEFLHLELTDGRILSIPLGWIPTLHNAAAGERAKYKISRDRKMVLWDPEECAINDEVRIEDYLLPRRGRK